MLLAETVHFVVNLVLNVVIRQLAANLLLHASIKPTHMRYLITATGTQPALTHWFDTENNLRADLNMVVYDLMKCIYTTDGVTWKPILEDHL